MFFIIFFKIMYLDLKSYQVQIVFFFTSGIIKVTVSEIIAGIIKTSSNNCLILGYDF